MPSFRKRRVGWISQHPSIVTTHRSPLLHYNRNLKPLARELRSNQTDSERLLWSRLRRKQLLGIQFQRQRPLGPYIVDFYSPIANLVIEVDGSQHGEPSAKAKDEERDKWLKGQGLTVLRFNSREVLNELDGVVQIIYQQLQEAQDHPSQPPKQKTKPPFRKRGLGDFP